VLYSWHAARHLSVNAEGKFNRLGYRLVSRNYGNAAKNWKPGMPVPWSWRACLRTRPSTTWSLACVRANTLKMWRSRSPMWCESCHWLSTSCMISTWSERAVGVWSNKLNHWIHRFRKLYYNTLFPNPNLRSHNLNTLLCSDSDKSDMTFRPLHHDTITPGNAGSSRPLSIAAFKAM
jgi:hypothetical protein